MLSFYTFVHLYPAERSIVSMKGCAVCSMQCAMCNVQCAGAVCNVQCAGCSVQWEVWRVKCLMLSKQCAVCIVQWAVCTTSLLEQLSYFRNLLDWRGASGSVKPGIWADLAVAAAENIWHHNKSNNRLLNFWTYYNFSYFIFF